MLPGEKSDLDFSAEQGWPDDPRSQKRYRYEPSWVRKLVRLGLIGTSPLWLTVKARGLENIPAAGGAILTSNHVSNWDTIVLEFAVPRYSMWMGKEALFTNRLNDWFTRAMGGFEVRRGQGDTWAIRFAQHVVEQGIVMGLFPEGTRSKAGQLKAGKSGPARLALATGCPIVPTAIWGSRQIMKPVYRRSVAWVGFAKPIYPQEGDTVESLTEHMMYGIASMLPAQARGDYAHPPKEYAHLFLENEPLGEDNGRYRVTRFVAAAG